MSTNGTNGHGLPPAYIATLAYSVSEVGVMLMSDGSLLIDGECLDQQHAWALLVALNLPGMRSTLNRIERTRQAAQVQQCNQDDDRR